MEQVTNQQKGVNAWVALPPHKQTEILDRIKLLVQSSTLDKKAKVALGDGWSFDLKSRTLFCPLGGDHGIANINRDEFIACTLHEIAHAKFSKTPPELEKNTGDTKEMFELLNALEDIRIETQIQNHYIGSRDNFKKAWKKTEEKLDPEFIKTLPEHHQFLMNAYIEFKKGSEIWGEDSANAKKLFEFLKPRMHLVKSFKTTKILFDWIKRELWEAYKDMIPPADQGGGSGGEGEEEQEQSKQVVKNANQQGGESDGNEKGDGEEEEGGGDTKEQEEPEQQETEKEQKQRERKEKKEEKKKKEEELQNRKESFHDLLGKAKQKPQEEKEGQEGEEPEETDKKGEGKDDSILADIQKTLPPEENDLDIFEEDILDLEPPATYESLLKKVQSQVPYFTSKLSSILKDNNARRFGGAFKKGKLSSKQLYKFGNGDERLFSQKIKRSHKKYTVGILVDQSGSMSGEKIKQATMSAILMAEVLKRVGVEFEIAGFNHKYTTYKPVESGFGRKAQDYLVRMIPATRSHNAGGNNDGYAINKMASRLRMHEGEKIMVVFSDGCPNQNFSPLPEEDRVRLRGRKQVFWDFNVEQEVQEASRDITCIGIGIQSDYVKRYYKEVDVIQKVDELPTKLLSAISKKIRRG